MGHTHVVAHHQAMTAEDTKAIAETVALTCAAVFFLWKVISGYLHVELGLSISSSRTPQLNGNDLLVVTAKLNKGARGSVRLHDVQVRLTFDGTVLTKPLIGFHRQSYRTETIGSTKRGVISWDKPSSSAPLLRLSPDEETEFSCYAEIPKPTVCVIELAVLGRESSWLGFSQWRASHVSTPTT
jgi:hypothetical protein